MIENISFWAYTLSFIGKILIILMALLVHEKVREERVIDDIVIKDINLEIYISAFALVLITIGYALHLMAI